MTATARGSTNQALALLLGGVLMALFVGFAATLQENTNLGEAVAGWTSVVTATMAPSAIGIWVRSE
ncbi:MAG: hypothetical protein WAL25_14755 [Acidimicrobiia bacterium]